MQGTPGGAPDAGPSADPSVGPMGAPMATPEPKNGKKEAAMVSLGQAQDLIEQVLPTLGSESEDGQALIAAIRALTKVIGPRKPKVGELQNAEIMQLIQSLPQGAGQMPGAPSPMPGAPGGAPQPPPPMAGPPGAGAPPPM